jgi:hypothetical protein
MKPLQKYVKCYIFDSVDIPSQLKEGYHVSIQCHDELEDKTINILCRIVNYINFCGTQ